jgi:hypothetical protein
MPLNFNRHRPRTCRLRLNGQEVMITSNGLLKVDTEATKTAPVDQKLHNHPIR